MGRIVRAGSAIERTAEKDEAAQAIAAKRQFPCVPPSSLGTSLSGRGNCFRPRLCVMAILYRAELRPTKMELLSRWLPDQPWFSAGGSAGLQPVGSYRFDDPDGEVGIEIHLVAVESTVFQVPLTYRGAPLHGGESALVCTMEHSVLGKRWIYDACADPVYTAALAATVLTGRAQAEQFLVVEGGLEAVANSVHVVSTGTPDARVPDVRPAAPFTVDGVTIIETGELKLSVVRVLDLGGGSSEVATITGTWEGQATPVHLASGTV